VVQFGLLDGRIDTLLSHATVPNTTHTRARARALITRSSRMRTIAIAYVVHLPPAIVTMPRGPTVMT
jgi:hypothetical protein